MKIQHIVWKSLENEGIEFLRLHEENIIIEASSVVIGFTNPKPYRLNYEMLCNQNYSIKKVKLHITDGKSLELATDSRGTWVDDKGVIIQGLDSCLDIDISATPFTNILPIRRLNLAVGESSEISVVYIKAPEMILQKTRQRYTHIKSTAKDEIYKYEGLETNFTAEIIVDKNGLVIDYPELFKRIW